MKDITFGFALSMLLTTLMFGMSLSLFAQGETPTVIKKKIEIKKIIDEDGHETTETIETEVEVNAEEWGNIEGEFDIDIDETIENGIKKRIVRVQVGNENGELPQEIQDELESLGIDINIIDGSEKRTIIIDSGESHEDGEGEHEMRIFKIAPGEELPEDVMKKFEEQGIHLNEMMNGEHARIQLHREKLEQGESDMMKFFRKENSSTIDRETQIFRIANIDDLDEEIIEEIEEIGVSVNQLRERFDEALRTVRIYKEGLENAKVELDVPGLQELMFMRGIKEEVIEIDSDTDFNWIEKKMEKRLEHMNDAIRKSLEPKPYFGIRMEDNEKGVIILYVAEDSPAEKAGLKKGDVITMLNDVAIKDGYMLGMEIRDMKPGDALEIGYIRKGETKTTNTTVGEVEVALPPTIRSKENKFMPRIPRIATKRGYLGVNLAEDATILSVKPESPAADAGLEAHDRLLQIGAIQVKTADEVIAAMEKALPGTNTDVTFERDDAQQTVTVVPTMPPMRKHRRNYNTCSPNDKSRWVERMKADCEKRCSTPFLGIYMEEKDRDFEDYNVKITGIVQNTGAEAAGILEGDELLKVNRASVSNVQDVVDEISKYEPGDKIKVQVLRDGKKKRIKATLSNQTQADIFSPCDCSTGEVNKDAMTTREIILIKENSATDAPQINIDTNEDLNLDEIDLFPNPNNGTFTVRFATENKAPTIISVIDVNGKEVYRQDVQNFNGRYDNQIDISNQARGTYFLNIIQGEKIYTEQFVFGKR